jgi:sulfide:quinone oxidoreductase
MQIKPLVDGLSVSPQLEVADLAALAALGFRSVINNRPDHEEPNQPPSAALKAAAVAAGLAYRELPVVSGQVTDAQAMAFGEALAQPPGPTLAFCRTGTRSTTLWALHAARRGADVDGILATAAKAGYDLAALRSRLEQA